jgi:hypothetical protein
MVGSVTVCCSHPAGCRSAGTAILLQAVLLATSCRSSALQVVEPLQVVILLQVVVPLQVVHPLQVVVLSQQGEVLPLQLQVIILLQYIAVLPL